MKGTKKPAAGLFGQTIRDGRLPAVPVMVALIILLTIVFLFSLTIGRYGIPIKSLLQIFFERLVGQGGQGTVETVLFNVRVPRILCGMMVGAALAGSGATYQGIFKNPMVSPDILGASAGAGFGAALAILNNFNIVGIEMNAFLFGLAAVGLTYSLSSVIGRKTNAVLVLVLTGMVVQSLFSSFTSITKLVADPNNKLQEITFWLMGGLNSTTNREALMMFVPFVIGFVPLFLYRWQINLLSFGEEEAKAMGVNTGRVRFILIIAATLLTAASISISGMVGWVGLIIPHFARLIVGPDYKKLLPASVLIGAAFLLLVDGVARTAFITEIPLGILTAIIGAPFFLYMLFKLRSGWS